MYRAFKYGAFLAALAFGAYRGYSLTHSSGISIITEKGSMFLEYSETGKRYELHLIKGELFLGDAVHQIYGAKELIIRAPEDEKRKIRELSSRLSELEKKVYKIPESK